MSICTSTSNRRAQEQLDLFLEPASDHLHATQFLQPSAKNILVDEIPLADFLKKKGLKKALMLENLLEKLDWEPFLKAYPIRGRTALHPRIMVGLILLAKLNSLHSLRAIERFAVKDLEAWYITGGHTPDHATIGLFMVRHQETLAGTLFEDLTRVILQGSISKTLCIDGTTIQAKSSTENLFTAPEIEKLLQDAKNDSDETLIEKLKIALEVVKERDRLRKERGNGKSLAQVSPLEPEAPLQPLKEGPYTLAYKPTIGVNEDQIILSQEVHPTSETATVVPILDQAERTAGPAEEVLADAHFFNGETFQALENRAAEPLIAPGQPSKNFEQTPREVPKQQFIYNEQNQKLTCPEGFEMKPYPGTKAKKEVNYIEYLSDPKNCAKCLLRNSCLSGKKKRRKVKIYPKIDPAKAQMREKFKDPEVRRRYGRRFALVEPPFAWIKGVLGLRRFLRRGLALVKMEWSLCCAAYNAMKWMKRLAAA